MKSEEGIHILARAVIVEDGKLLVTTDIARNVSFLPGGHIHYGEKSKDCLTRELAEELGEQFEVTTLLGVVEDGWDYNGQLYHGVHLIFKAEAQKMGIVSRLKSNEKTLDLDWIPLDELAQRTNLFPKLLITKIAEWINKPGIDFCTEWTWTS